jgi:hypothetical protein
MQVFAGLQDSAGSGRELLSGREYDRSAPEYDPDDPEEGYGNSFGYTVEHSDHHTAKSEQSEQSTEVSASSRPSAVPGSWE